jgi:hypothetical protein
VNSLAYRSHFHFAHLLFSIHRINSTASKVNKIAPNITLSLCNLESPAGCNSIGTQNSSHNSRNRLR